jgi:molecular chaperone GrpE
VSDPRPADERPTEPPDDPAEVSPEEAAAEVADGDPPDDAAGPPDPPAAGSPGDGPVDVEALVADLERVTAERDQFLDAYRRAQADYENFRKQTQRRQEDAVGRTLGGFIERLLPVLDACDAAMSHGASEVEPIVNSLYGALEKEGLQRVAPTGDVFDPTVAEAVVHDPGGGGEHVVSEVLRPGYTWNGRVLRPAMVKVTD